MGCRFCVERRKEGLNAEPIPSAQVHRRDYGASVSPAISINVARSGVHTAPLWLGAP